MKEADKTLFKLKIERFHLWENSHTKESQTSMLSVYRTHVIWLTCTPIHFVTSLLSRGMERSNGIPMKIFRLDPWASG